MMDEPRRHVIDLDRLPANFPTHLHAPEFWEALGRTVATFGFLEETLGKAIFSFTATRPYEEAELEAAFEAWVPKLERALSDALGGLIDSFGKAVRDHKDATISNLPELLEDLRKAAEVRNVLCHGSWRAPDRAGRSLPLYVTRKNKVFDTLVDLAFLEQTQRHVIELACSVMDNVTHMGWQFPGSNGPGEPIFKGKKTP